MSRKVKLGVIGLGKRGFSLLKSIFETNMSDIVAVCDTYEDRIQDAKDECEKYSEIVPIGYTDYHELLLDNNVEAVLIATPWSDHVRMAIESMKAGKITAMEVCGATDIEECWDLVKTYEETKTPFMFLENCCYGEFELLSLALVKAGKLGTVVHCSGAYSHDLRPWLLRGYVDRRNYRVDNYIHRNADTYPTHELGPIARVLNINRGNRMVSLVSMASKACGLEEYSYTDKNLDQDFKGVRFAHGDIVTTIIKCANGETITLKLDTTLPTFYSRDFTVRGTKGMCVQDANMVLLEEDTDLEEFFKTSETLKKHLDNANNYKEYLPQCYAELTDEMRKAGHGGMDCLVFKDFFTAILNGTKMPIDVYDAASWMCITALTEISIANGGAPQSIPDFTRGKWVRPMKNS